MGQASSTSSENPDPPEDPPPDRPVDDRVPTSSLPPPAATTPTAREERRLCPRLAKADWRPLTSMELDQVGDGRPAVRPLSAAVPRDPAAYENTRNVRYPTTTANGYRSIIDSSPNRRETTDATNAPHAARIMMSDPARHAERSAGPDSRGCEPRAGPDSARSLSSLADVACVPAPARRCRR